MPEKIGVYVSEEVLVRKDENSQGYPVKTISSAILELVWGVINRLKDAELSYSQISKVTGINKGQICMLHNRTWSPTTRESENKIIRAILGRDYGEN
jgi:hypothetical protein